MGTPLIFLRLAVRTPTPKSINEVMDRLLVLTEEQVGGLGPAAVCFLEVHGSHGCNKAMHPPSSFSIP